MPRIWTQIPLFLDYLGGRQSLNSLFTVPTTESVLAHLQMLLDKGPDTKEAIHNVYDLPSIELVIRYLHAAAAFPEKSHLAQEAGTETI